MVAGTGIDSVSSTPPPGPVTAGGLVTIGAVVTSGYVFSEWTNDGGVTLNYPVSQQNNDFDMPPNDVTFTAVAVLAPTPTQTPAPTPAPTPEPTPAPTPTPTATLPPCLQYLVFPDTPSEMYWITYNDCDGNPQSMINSTSYNFCTRDPDSIVDKYPETPATSLATVSVVGPCP